jgi:hypothetical protein
MRDIGKQGDIGNGKRRERKKNSKKEGNNKREIVKE